MAALGHRIRLTPREREIVQAILDGCTNREIASRLSVREQSVRNALTVIYGKFHVRTRLQLARVAFPTENW
jgi:DNA-binding NarL/FixJ family response regulator